MNKKEAADYLGVSVRALERYVQQGKVGVVYLKGITRSTANFNRDELDRFKEELNQPIIKPAFDSRQMTTEETKSPGVLAKLPGEVSEFGEVTTIDKLATIIECLLADSKKQPSVEVRDKLLLSINDVRLLTGLPVRLIKDVIVAGELPAKLIGRSWRVKRSDLQEWVEGLF